MKRTCGNCEQTDGIVYTSNPPQVRCNLTNDYHFMNDECTVECAPIPKNEYITVKQIELTDETIDKIAEKVVAMLGEKLK